MNNLQILTNKYLDYYLHQKRLNEKLFLKDYILLFQAQKINHTKSIQQNAIRDAAVCKLLLCIYYCCICPQFYLLLSTHKSFIISVILAQSNPAGYLYGIVYNIFRPANSAAADRINL